MLADQVTAGARASTCAYNTVASKFVTNYRVDKSKEESPRSPPSALSLEELVEDTQAHAVVDLGATSPTTPRVKNVEFGPERTLKISSCLSPSQEKELCSLLTCHLEAFSPSYKEMKGIHSSFCTHHIYIKEDCKPVRQPQSRMNLALKDILKE